MQFVLARDVKDWAGWTFVMPTVSVGNVDQLAISLLVENTASKMVGFAISEHLVPIVGRHKGALITSINVYECSEKRLVIMQQRSPMIRKKYIDELVDWVASVNFGEVILMTGVIACERTDEQLTGNQCRFLLSKSLESRKNDFTNVLPELEKRKTQNTRMNGEGGNEVESSHDDDPFMPGSGIAVKMFKKCEEKGLNAVVLLRFSYEGENASDAANLADVTNKLYHWLPLLEHQKWKRPDSWSHLFGNPFDQALFQ